MKMPNRSECPVTVPDRPVRAGVGGRALRAFLLAAALVLGMLSVVLPAGAQQLQAVPKLSGPVVDTVGLLSPDTREALTQQLLALQERKGSQLAVLVVATTQPEPIEAYSIRVAEAWKLGRGKAGPSGQEVDDGVLLLVARDDRRARIEVGYGLEGAISDGIARRIIDQQLLPHFRQQDWDGGVQAAVDALQARIDGEALPEPSRAVDPFDTWAEDMLPLMFFLGIGGVIASGIIGRWLASIGAGGIMGFSAFGILGSPIVAAICGAVVLGFVLLVTLGTSPGLQQVGRHTYRNNRRGGGWGGGLGGGGGFGGGFGGGGGCGGGGGFSGGGGGFGGGGASGGW